MSASEEGRSSRDKPGATAKPFSIRLTDEERRQIAERAGDRPLASFVRDLALSRVEQSRRQQINRRIFDKDAMARVLSALGQSNLSSSLATIAKAARVGTLPSGEETERAICEASDAIKEMRRDLVRALGLHEREQP